MKELQSTSGTVMYGGTAISTHDKRLAAEGRKETKSAAQLVGNK